MSLTKSDIREVFNEGFETLVAPRFDALESRMDGLESRMDGLESRMDGLESRMDGLESRMSTQEHATKGIREEMRAGFATVNKRIDELEDRFSTQLSELEVDVRYLYKLVEGLQKFNNTSKDFTKQTIEQKIITLYKQVQVVAKDAGITLPQ
jgi:uncharacterized coiled-coil protein SlyX